VILTLGNHSTHVEFQSQDEVEWLVNFCAVKDDTNKYTMVDGVLKFNYNNLRHMFNQATRTFHTGLASLVVVHGTERGFPVQVVDQRVRAGFVDENADLSWLRYYQRDAVLMCAKRTRGVLRLVTGAGKCLGKGTPVLKFDGKVVPVESIADGDLLMGPDGLHREVVSTSRGYGPLYRIIPDKGDEWTCNDVHVLTLWDTNIGRLVDIALDECLRKPHHELTLLWGARVHGGALSLFKFDVAVLPDGDYFGFTLDGDGRFLLGDGTITHNTEIAIGITRAIQGVKWLFLAPETRLMFQAAERYEKRTGDVAGRIGDGDWSVGDVFTVATFQTISARLKANYQETCAFLNEFTGLVIDEVHVASAEEFVNVGEHVKNAYWRFGMSGTALDRGDRKDMLACGVLGRVVYYKPASELIAEGFVAMPRVVFHPYAHTMAPKANPLIVYSVNIVRSSGRNKLLVDLTEKAEKPAIVGVRTAVHGQALVKMLKERGVRAEFMHGGLTQEAQNRLLGRLKDLTTEVVVATKVLQTGTDIEEIATIVNARGNASTIETLQLCGRGMRMIRDAAGNIVKGYVDVIEIFDIAKPFINPLTGRKNVQKELKWLQDYSTQRVAAYKSMGYEVTVLNASTAPVQDPGDQPNIPLPP